MSHYRGLETQPDSLRAEASLLRAAAVSPNPIFIVGLHRSGTTALYRTLVEGFSVASLQVYHIAHYDELLRAAVTGTEQRLRSRIDRHFIEHDLRTRVVDDMEVSSASVEEYGWLLRRLTPTMRLSPRSLAVFSEMCIKLQTLKAWGEDHDNLSTPPVLLKNPWDTRNVGAIATWFPRAKFIFLWRDPVAVLHSQFRNAIHYGRDVDPYLDFMLRGIPVAKAVIGAQRAFYRIFGETLYGKLLLRFVEGDIVREVRHYRNSLCTVPAERKFELSYEEFVTAPEVVIQHIATFLGLPVRNIDAARRVTSRSVAPHSAAIARQQALVDAVAAVPYQTRGAP